jgi:hypothetical protein
MLYNIEPCVVVCILIIIHSERRGATVAPYTRRAPPMIYDLRTYAHYRCTREHAERLGIYVFRFICTCRGVLLYRRNAVRSLLRG